MVEMVGIAAARLRPHLQVSSEQVAISESAMLYQAKFYEYRAAGRPTT
jgi:hypothetical protein